MFDFTPDFAVMLKGILAQKGSDKTAVKHTKQQVHQGHDHLHKARRCLVRQTISKLHSNAGIL